MAPPSGAWRPPQKHGVQLINDWALPPHVVRDCLILGAEKGEKLPPIKSMVFFYRISSISDGIEGENTVEVEVHPTMATCIQGENTVEVEVHPTKATHSG